MMIEPHQLERIARQVAKAEAERKEIARKIKLESYPVKPVQLNGKVAAVDGGLIRKPLHGFDCLLYRAVAVCFHYKSGKLQSVSYLPTRKPKINLELFENLSELDWVYASGLYRLEAELKLALECLKSWEPDWLLLDGPLYPHYAERPGKGSQLKQKWEEILGLYRQLYKQQVLGIVEDSRSQILCSSLSRLYPEFKEVLERSRDTALLTLLMKESERTRVFEPEESIVLKELGQKIKSFYLKPSRHDRPYRVDFVSGDPDAIAGLLLAISSKGSYSIPAPLIEADLNAKLSEEDFERFYSALSSRIPSVGIQKLRRDLRPI